MINEFACLRGEFVIIRIRVSAYICRDLAGDQPGCLVLGNLVLGFKFLVGHFGTCMIDDGG